MQTVKRQVLEEARGRKVVQASLNYIAQTSEKPVYYAYDPLPETARQTGLLISADFRRWQIGTATPK
jgi:hypothetical protein